MSILVIAPTLKLQADMITLFVPNWFNAAAIRMSESWLMISLNRSLVSRLWLFFSVDPYEYRYVRDCAGRNLGRETSPNSKWLYRDAPVY